MCMHLSPSSPLHREMPIQNLASTRTNFFHSIAANAINAWSKLGPLPPFSSSSHLSSSSSELSLLYQTDNFMMIQELKAQVIITFQLLLVHTRISIAVRKFLQFEGVTTILVESSPVSSSHQFTSFVFLFPPIYSRDTLKIIWRKRGPPFSFVPG